MAREFFLGRFKGNQEESRALISSDRFTTHAVVIGMTGSGKTGLIVDILEEAALSGIPTVVIDPKGDLTDRLLVFPEARPEDFSPFCPEGRAGETASRWAEGLRAWGLTAQDSAALKALPVRVFTPGASTSPINVLQRFDPPPGDDPEQRGASALGAVSSLFLLAGFSGDPATSPEGLLVNQLLLKAWSEGSGLTLEALVGQVLTPPLERLGVMDLDAVIPARDRTALAMKLNALLASPSLALWRRGESLDLDALLGGDAGGATTIFTLAHLSEGERLFFLGLLLSELSAWTRRQSGSDHLRCLLVFDEVYGFFPPYPLNPPTKGPLLALLKQARAFGVGLVLATQNPVDLDYKGLTNAGLWFLGRLQTEPDRRRVADALGTLPGGGAASVLLSDLPPRTFVVHDVKGDHPRLLETRHCLSYLAGPLTPPQLKSLLPKHAENTPNLPDPPVAEALESARSAAVQSPALSRPVVPAGWEVTFGSGSALIPHLEVEAEISYRAAPKTAPFTSRVMLAWPLDGTTLEGSLAAEAIKTGEMRRTSELPAGSSCDPLPPFFDRTDAARASKTAAASIVLRQSLTLLKDPVTGILQQPGESEREFETRVNQQRQISLQTELDKVLKTLRGKLQRAQDRISRLEMELQQDQSDASARNAETVVSAGLGILGGLFGSRRSIGGAISRTVGKTRMASRAEGEVHETRASLEAARRDRDQLQQEFDSAQRKISARFGDQTREAITLLPSRSGVQILTCRLLWAGRDGR
jgi:hypothetical protein